MCKAPGYNGKLLRIRSKSRLINNRPGDLSNSLMATAWERDMVLACWLPVEVAVVGEADLDVRTAAELVVAPEFEQAVNVPLVVGRGSSS